MNFTQLIFSHGYANPTVDGTGYTSSNQYVGQYGGIEYSSHYETNMDSTNVYSSNSPAQVFVMPEYLKQNACMLNSFRSHRFETF